MLNEKIVDFFNFCSVPVKLAMLCLFSYQNIKTELKNLFSFRRCSSSDVHMYVFQIFKINDDVIYYLHTKFVSSINSS